jgi:hypothetical protein
MRTAFDDIRPARLIEQPKRPRLRRKGVSLRTAAIVAILFAAGLVLLAGHEPPLPPAAPVVVAATAPEWIDIENPLQLFDLSAPDLANLPEVYTARRNSRGGGRQDILTFGALDSASPFFRLSLYRIGRESVADVPLFVELVRLGAAIDLSVVRSANPGMLPTRFGPLETADIDLAAAAAAPEPCLGFRGAGLNGGFRLSGFACGTRVRPLTRPALACLLDRLELDGGGDDPALVTYFANSEFNRDPSCAGAALAPGPSKVNWIDANDAPPPLKLRKMR